MNLAHLSDDRLDAETVRNAQEELNAMTRVLHHLREVDRRRLFSKLKYTSLFDYTVRRLKYSSDQADRRIVAMRLMKEHPEIEEKIQSGALSLTNLGMARTLFKREMFSRAEKADFLKRIESKSTRQVARLIATISPQALSRDRITPVSQDHDKFEFLSNPQLREKIARLRGAIAHSHPNIGLGELFEMLVDLGLEHWDKTAAPRDSKRQGSLKEQVMWRDKRCENCGSTHALEVDHRIPLSHGGQDTLENLRALCRNCNQRAAIEKLGIKKMEPYLGP